ncbi:DEAD/DEAH box helicase [Aquimarina brevivitae]|uniref:AAA domain-containing protein n=1 Tax=Aquimarina brevivitae TaxID=323412 RepID=A0A4Q7P1T7_9FLAO|nr:ATP-binding protein [Aquimarina brevivitae]RZS92612.1 AAA domain-containing protein [Aquimarina brevivitae]
MKLKRLLHYLSDCYESDNREFKIENFFSTKFENQYLQPLQEDLITGAYNEQYITDKEGNDILTNLNLYEKDKELFYCSLFFVGKRKLFTTRATKICAPLLFYPAEIVELDQEYYIRINRSEQRINQGFLRGLEYKTSFELFYQELEKKLNVTNIDYSFVAGLSTLVEKHMHQVTIADEMLFFPKLCDPAKFKNYFKQHKQIDSFVLYPVSGLIVSSKANNIQNVVVELNRLKKVDEFSEALCAYLGQVEKKEIKNYVPKLAPFILNAAQEKSVVAANQYAESVIIGPPGTGKSYTVSAIAIDHLSQGKSVLIATRTDEALQVISDKIASFPVGRYSVKAGGPRYLISLIAILERILYRFDNLPFQKEMYGSWEYLNKIQKRVQAIEADFATIDTESSKLTRTLLYDTGVLKSLKLGFVKLFRSWEKKEWKLIEEYKFRIQEEIDECNKRLMGQVLLNIKKSREKHFKELQGLINTLKNDNLSKKAEQLSAVNFSAVTETLPLWLTKIESVSEVIPLKKELFDLLIIDEATQCDIASILPLLQRAKKVVITGDTKQLRHLSFLSKDKMKALALDNGIQYEEKYNYRKKSVLDFVLESVDNSNQISVLNEHYRSLPEIIKFSNQEFYDNDLLIMNDLPKYRDQSSVFLTQLAGKRNKKGANEVEAETIVAQVLEVIYNEREIRRKECSSLGIISPFKDQVTHIGKLLKSKVDLSDIKKHNIRIGTPYSFQGDEKDIVFLSFVVDDQTHHSAFNHMNKDDVFNVMITRARIEQRVFYSCDPKKLKTDSLLRLYLEKALNKKVAAQNTYFDKFTEEVCAFINGLGQNDIQCRVGYKLSGLTIDILIDKKDRYLGIDLIGYPGDYESSFSLERYRVLYRVGISIIPLSYLTWYFDENIKNRIAEKIQLL